ncbi:MAG: molybdate ABC transporter substrate-binding protein [Peptococcaceae bacterium]|nr:molybdate ABC transporter substrate-binding protein [Peptococcaceae bacterium]
MRFKKLNGYLAILIVLMLLVTACGQAGPKKVDIAVFHADSLAGPMKELKAAFEAKNPDVNVTLVSGKSKDLAGQIMSGFPCDVFTPSDPKVIKDSLLDKKIPNSDKVGATWSVVFSANEMVIVTKKGNPLGIKQVSDLAKADVKLARVNSATDMATARTVTFVTKATEAEGQKDLAKKIIDGATSVDNIPAAIKALQDGSVNTAIMYYSSAVTIQNDFDVLRYPADVNLSSEIRNAATIPGTAGQKEAAAKFISLILSPEGQEILKKTGQPPVVPPIKDGNVPPEINF